MTERKINKESVHEFYKLSIQVSLNGLSFCVLDTISNSISASDTLIFEEEQSPFSLKKGLATLLERHSLDKKKFSEVVVVHRNNLFSLVPKSLFDKNELANYLKFNTKLLTTDHLTYDEIEGHDMVNVYVPFANVNNYIYDLFGEFTFTHHGTVLIETLLRGNVTAKAPTCFLHIANQQLDLTIIANKKLLLYNSYEYTTKEDLIYYLLFAMEQLDLDTEKTKLKLFGAIEEGDALYAICHAYIQDISIFVPDGASYPFVDFDNQSIDFTVLNTL